MVKTYWQTCNKINCEALYIEADKIKKDEVGHKRSHHQHGSASGDVFAEVQGTYYQKQIVFKEE